MTAAVGRETRRDLERRTAVWNDIGQIAGDVWRYLDRHGETSALKLRSALKVPQSRLFLALGWLGREGKVEIGAEDRGYKVSLRR